MALSDHAEVMNRKIPFFVMKEPKNQDVKGALIVYADGLTGIKEAIVVIFPKTAYRCCILPFWSYEKMD